MSRRMPGATGTAVTGPTRADENRAARVRRWVLLCAAAEAVGMSASAAAARSATALQGAGRGAAAAWGVVVLGGLVEGTAVGLAQAAALKPLVPSLDHRRLLLVTVAVAGLGWAAASAPSVLAADDGDAEPGWAVVVGGAAALGLVMGAVLGAAQAWVLRPAVRRPGRWVGISVAAWTPAMVAIFAGATVAPASWPAGAVVLLGTVTGLVAGALLGAVSGVLAPALGPPRACVRCPPGSEGPSGTGATRGP
ncbi:hypothetical protein [Georgenia yuyongxinii]|uniref:Uncharacterized protein n=1 Tax=Georgenia yuyongxinii TaxID=2589797 RepID=A0A552WMX1_9MICO|nr:hypothetical protein [Georgenia yuyongxinii]TRW44090.1 hypothetical protein FJ693_15095 [Georgenia yuyongxinii]